MAIEKVREYLKQFNAADRIVEFTTSSATVELAAEAVGCIPARIAKSLAFQGEDKVIMVVMAGDAKVDNAKYKHTFGFKARMLPLEEAESKVGHAVGGVCPFALNDGVEVYLDDSLKRFETVYPACGSANSAIEATIAQLEEYSQNFIAWVDVAKGWQEN